MNVLMKRGELLNNKGELNECGFAFEQVKDYRKSSVNAPLQKLKEWDYYYIYNEHYSISLLCSDLSTNGLFAVSYVNFDDNTTIYKSYKVSNTYGNVCMPTTANYQDIKYENKKFSFEFISDFKERKLIVLMKNFAKEEGSKEYKDFYCVINLKERIDGNSVSARDFKEESNCFIFNNKIHCMQAEGFFKIGEEKLYFYPSNSMASLDWMRCVLPNKSIVYMEAQCSNYTLTKKEIGFTISSNYGDCTCGNNNMFFYDKRAFKLDDCDIIIPIDAYGNKLYKSIWTIKTNVSNVKEDINTETNEVFKELFIEFEPSFDYNLKEKMNKNSISANIIYGTFRGYIYFNENKIEFNNLKGTINCIDLKL